ncbi:MAG: hypothetical protein IKL73_02185 [Lachnospiraceae bacterium]|nr:hypothetical protein [Lachnospiraceae bacterium]
MKRILCFALLCALCLNVIACDKKEKKNNETEPVTTQEATTSWLEAFDQLPVVDEAFDDTMVSLLDYRGIVVLSEPDTSYTDEALLEIVWSKLVEETVIFKVPKDISLSVNARMERFVEEHKNNAEQVYKMDFVSYLKGNGYTEEEFYADVEDYKHTFIKQQMIVYAIAKEEGILATDDEMKKALADYMKTYNVTQESELSSHMGQYYLADIEFEIIMSKVKDKILYFAKLNLK